MKNNTLKITFSICFPTESYPYVSTNTIEEIFDDNSTCNRIFANRNKPESRIAMQTENKMFPTKLDAFIHVREKIDEQINQIIEEEK
jgi:hypothetical protein